MSKEHVWEGVMALGLVLVVVFAIVSIEAARNTASEAGTAADRATLAARVAEDTAAKLRNNQLASCERGNLVRREINRRGQILRSFLRSAATVRLKQAAGQREEGTAAALLQAKLNEDVAAMWNGDARTLDPVEVPICAEVVAGG